MDYIYRMIIGSAIKHHEGGRMMMKKVCLGMFMAVLMLAAVMTAPVCHAKTTAKNWYKQELKKTAGTYKYGKNKINRKDYKYYTLTDINQDGVKELILSTRKGDSLIADDRAVVLRYYKGKVKAVLAVDCYHVTWFYGNKESKSLAVLTTGSDGSITPVYNLKNGKLKKRTTFTVDHHTDGVYFKGKKTLSRERFYELTGKYGIDDKACLLHFKKIS